MKTKPASILWELIGRLANATLTIRISGEEGVGKEAIAGLLYRHYPYDDADFYKIDGRRLTTGPCPSTNTTWNNFLASPQNTVLYMKNMEFVTQEIQNILIELLNTNFPSHLPWIIVSSQRPLERYIADGQINKSLFSILDTLHITLPPLRSQPEKIPQILSWFLTHFHNRNPLSQLSMPTIEEMERLTNYDWPANWRQLHEVTRLAFKTQSWKIPLEDPDPGNDTADELDSMATIYILSMAKLGIQKSRVIESMIAASDQDELGLLDLAIFNEAVNQISDHIGLMQKEDSDDMPTH
jgi:DNA-binding NtrC family response regulator